MTQLAQSLVDAVSLGALYALAALGIGLVFGVMRLANFAHGELITAAAYALILTWHLGPVISVLISLIVGVGLAILMEFLVFRRLRTTTPATLLIASFGLSFLLQRVYEALLGTNVRTAPVGSGLAGTVTLLGLRLQILSLVTIVLTAVLLLGVRHFLTRTSLGLQVRAASADFRTARLLGVRADRVIMLTFGISGALAAVVAFVMTVQTGAVGPTFGMPLTVLALVGAVIGGIDRVGGSLVGGFLMGFASSVFSSWLPEGIVRFRDAFVFLLVILVLLVRPAGLFAGSGTVERT
jgi:branched-chain amino acid transport system permease protein